MFQNGFVIIAVLFFKGVFLNGATLSPSTLDVLENSSITLTCTLTGNVSGWKLSDVWAYIAISNDDTCQATGFINETSLYAWNCLRNGSFSLTMLKVDRQQHGEKWICRQGFNTLSNEVVINVRVPVESAEIVTPTENTTSIVEKEFKLFICKTSYSRPKPSVKWFIQNAEKTSQINLSISDQAIFDKKGFISLQSDLNTSVSKDEQGAGIYCTGTNGLGADVSSRTVVVNVYYAPERGPYINEASNNSFYTLREDINVTITCISPLGNPPPKLSWNCSGAQPTSYEDKREIKRSLQWKTKRNEDKVCRCTSEQVVAGINTAFIRTVVLYPPKISKIKIRHTELNQSIPVNKTIHVIENETFTLICEAKSKPEPSYKWTGKANSNVSTIIIVNKVTRERYVEICHATNFMNFSNGDQQTVNVNRSVNVDILYPPEIISMKNKRVIEGSSVKFSCKIINGNPATTRFRWTREFNDMYWLQQTFIIQNVSRNDSMRYTCVANNTMVMTGNMIKIGSASQNINLEVLYPPTITKIKFRHTELSQSIQVHKTIYVIENETFTLICEADSKPEPSYKWTGKTNSNNSTIIIENPTKRETYVETCHATNFMNFSNGEQQMMNVNRSVYVDILYPPEISLMRDKRVIEGSSANFSCQVRNGNPNATGFTWTREFNNKQWLQQSFVIRNVSRNDSMRYTCVANNTMVMTGNIIKIGSASRNINLEVLYPPNKPTLFLVSISNLTINVTITYNLTVEENTPFTLSCKADSLPKPDNYSWRPETISNSSIFHSFGLSRDDKKEVTCNVSNTMVSNDEPLKTGQNYRTVTIDIQFSPGIGSIYNISSEEGRSVNFSCPVIYGNPKRTTVMWMRKGDGQQWNGANFTLENVSRTDSTVYTCRVNNTMALTGGILKEGKQRKSIELNVLYKANILKYFAVNITGNGKVTIAENQTVNLTCTIEGNPNPEGGIFGQSQFDIVKHVTESYTIFSAKFAATCFHKGIYTCRGFNAVNRKHISERNITLYVTCSPRPNPTAPLKNRIKTYKNNALIVNFTVLAYPEPNNVSISKYNGQFWKSINDSSNLEITVSGLDVHFTIHRVSEEDYGKYNFTISNEFGKYEHVFYVEHPGEESLELESPNPSTNYGLVIGLPLAVIVIITIIVVGIIWYRRRNAGVPGKLIYQNVPFTGKKRNNKRKIESQHSVEAYSEELQDIDDVPHYFTEPTEYYNSAEKIEQIERIKVSELYSYVSEKSYESFGIDYQKLPSVIQKPCTFARKPENLPLNRYNGIYPYDHSRVKIPTCPDFFINACYIDGYKRKKAYIACLGPTTKTTRDFRTFWQMVWHEETDVIVMLTNLNEPSGMKCEQYWPSDGSNMDYGEISVISKSSKVFAEYTIRIFHIINNGRKRSLTHLHFTAWPDKTVPEDVTCLLEFRRRMKSVATSSKGPIIVHCSAGIGRTGTLIAIDRLIEEGKDLESVNVYECVEKMRDQRVKMVQTLEQYVYIYKALVNALVFDSETISQERFVRYVEQVNDAFYKKELKQMSQTIEKDGKDDSDARGKHMRLINYNRHGADIPGFRFRVMLCLTRQCGDHDYVNAVYINTFEKKDYIIIAQTPLPDTVEDFLSMIYNESCNCVVTMEDLTEPGAMIGQYMSADDQSRSFGNFTVSCSQLETKDQYIVRQIKIKYNGRIESKEKVMYHFQYTQWMPGQETPVSARDFLNFIEKVENYDREFGDEYSHIIVHCLKANERSGLFCAVKILKEKMKEEKEVNVVNVLRHLRTRRPTAITCMEQIKFCYQAVSTYIKMHKR